MQSAFFPSQQQQGSKVDELRVHTSASSKRAAVTHTGSPTRHAAAGSISQSTCSSSRALRFPSSRRYLWDRTPAGPQVLIDVLDYLPHVQVAASTFGAISRAASNRASRVTLQLGFSVSSTNQVAALIQEHDPLSEEAHGGIQGALQLSCALSPPRDAAAAGEGAMRASMQAQVEQRDIARVHQLYVLSASAAAAASPAEPNKLALQLLMPRAGLLATPLYTKRLCHVPLAEALLKPGGMAAGQTGYLSMDQARSLLPLEATDSNVYSTPLVGVWVKGPLSVLHPLAAAACLRFACSSLLMDRAVNPEDGSFILLLCPEGDPVSKCFEVSLTDSTKLELCCYQLEAAARSAGLSQCPGGLVSATWVPERCQVEPLPGPLAAAHGSTALLPAGSASGLARHSRAASATGTPSRAAAAYFQSRGVQGQSPAAADSPVLRGHGLTSRAGDLGLARSSAPSAAYGFGTAAQVQQSSAAAAATAARRSLPLTGYADSYGCGGQQGALGPAAGRLVNQEEQAMAAGLTPWGADEPQPRTGVPAVPYMQGSSAQGSSAQGSRQPWQQQQQVARDADACWSTAARAGYSSEQGTALSPATASDGALGATCSSPTKGSRQQQLTWSDRQDQVLRRSLEGAAEALRSSQASLAAARDAASGAGSRLGSPTKVRAGAAEAQTVFPEASLTQSSAAGAAGAQQDVDYGSGAAEDGGGGAAGGPGYSSGPGAISGSPQPALSRLQHQRPQQQQLGDDAESDCGPRMGSPVRMSMQKKASLLAAAAAAHAAGVAAPSAPAAAAGTTGGQDADGERPVSPAVQAGVALSNLSLLQHLSAGQLQQDGHGGLEAVGEAAVAAATGSPVRHTSAVGAGASGVQHGEHQLPGQYRPARRASAAWAVPTSSDQVAAAQAYHAANAVHSQHGVTTAAGAVVDSYNASHAAAAAIRAASSSMQRVPAHPYSSQSLGVQRYSADAAVMHNSSTGSPGGMGLLSPGSSPGLLRDSQHAARWTPLQQHQQQWQHQQQGVPARLPAAWSPGQGAAPSPGLMRPASSSGAGGGVDWQRQQRYSAGQQQQQLVSPVSVALSPGWVPDPVAQALQGEVDRLRQQLQQLQQQLKLAGMALPHPEAADAASGAATPEAGLALALPGPPAASPAAASAAAGSPIHVHNVYPVHVNVWMPGKQQQQQAEGAHTASAAGVAHQEEWELQQQILPPGAPHSLQEQHWAAHRYPAVSYAGTPTAAQQSSASAAAALTLAAPAAGGGGGADAGLHPVEFPDSSSKHHCAEGSAAAGSSTRANVDVGAPVGMPGAAAAAAKAAVPDEARRQVLTAAPASHGAAAHPAYLRRPDAPSNLQPASAPTQEQQQEDEGRAAAAAADAALLQQQQQQQATASAARQRRRRLDFDAAAAAAAAAAAERSSDADSHGSPSNESDENAGAGKGAAGSAGPTSGSVSAAAGAAAAPHARESPKGGVTDPAPCSSPALKPTAAVKAAATVAAAAVESPAGAAAASRGALRSSAASSCAGVRYSGPRSSGAGLGHLRASLDAPPLVEVVRARMVDLSEDSDSDEWEDRLLVKYGLK